LHVFRRHPERSEGPPHRLLLLRLPLPLPLPPLLPADKIVILSAAQRSAAEGPAAPSAFATNQMVFNHPFAIAFAYSFCHSPWESASSFAGSPK